MLPKTYSTGLKVAKLGFYTRSTLSWRLNNSNIQSLRLDTAGTNMNIHTRSDRELTCLKSATLLSFAALLREGSIQLLHPASDHVGHRKQAWVIIKLAAKDSRKDCA